MSDEPKYRCPILLDAHGNPYPPMTLAEVHAETLSVMVRHLRDDNHWTDKQVADWQETAQPIDN